jgi:DNA primase
MRFRGREIDPLELWSDYVEFPANVKLDGEFLPKVVCPNPEHDTNKRHFQINAEKGLVHCFAGCGISGTYVRAIALIEGCTEREASRIVLRRGKTARKVLRNSRGGNIVRERGEENTAEPSLEYSRYIPQAGTDYLRRRGISEGSVANFQIGWDKEDLRLVIPAKDMQGETRLLIKRAVKQRQQPKYLYSEGFAKTSLLFGACDLDPRVVQSEGIVIVEGSLDRIILWQLGITTAVATLGTGISEIQSRIIERYRAPVVYLMFDRDISGVHGIQIARARLPKSNLRVCRYPAGKYDPGEFRGKEAHRSIAKAVPISKFFNPNAR